MVICLSKYNQACDCDYDDGSRGDGDNGDMRTLDISPARKPCRYWKVVYRLEGLQVLESSI